MTEREKVRADVAHLFQVEGEDLEALTDEIESFVDYVLTYIAV